MKKLPRSYYLNPDVIALARDLVGKRLCTCMAGKKTSGIITETEAYAGAEDRASHAYGGRLTPRTKVMFMPGATAYVYLCYGMHSLFNVVTNEEGIPHAILIRSIEPDYGIPTILRRRKHKALSPRLTCGPGNIAKSLGINTKHTGLALTGNRIWIEETNDSPELLSAARIGVDYAGSDAAKPYRFLKKHSLWVTHRPSR